MITLYVPVCAQNPIHVVTLAALKYNSSIQPVIVDQASPPEHEKLLRRTFPDLRYEKFPTNQGIVWPLKFAEEDCTAELGGSFHSDFVVYQRGWDDYVDWLFQRNPKLGVLGFFGAMSALENGGRCKCYSSMNGWHLHSSLLDVPRTCAVLDGMGMIWRTSALKEIGGFDMQFGYEVYDRDFCLSMIAGGWEVGMAPLQCHHSGSVDWFAVAHTIPPAVSDPIKRYNEKWKNLLPYTATGRILEC